MLFLSSIDPARIASWFSEVHMQELNDRIFEEPGDHFLDSVPFDYIGSNQHVLRIERPDR